MSQQNILNDIGTVTKIPNRILVDLTNLAIACISSEIADAKAAQQEALSINIGIGTLGINLQTMECKFVPGKELKYSIKESLEGNRDLLSDKIEQASIAKLINICEEVI